MNLTKALSWTAVWVSAALLCNAGVFWFQGQEKGLEFLTAYVMEFSLSMDNLFVFFLIFSYFKTGPTDQHKILTWGVLLAQLLRLIFILGGIGLLQHLGWIIYVFGGFLVFSGVKVFVGKDKRPAPGKSSLVRFLRHRGISEFLIVLLVIELTDIVFAVDSIPAVLSVTKDPLIVYGSNILAVIGLRSLYFVLAGVINKFRYLHYGLGVILVFVGAKMLTEHFFVVPIGLALAFIVLALMVSILISCVRS